MIYQSEKIIQDTFEKNRKLWLAAVPADQYFASAEENNEKRFFRESRNQPVKRTINSVYRIRKGKDEFLFYHEHLVSKNRLQNKTDHTRTIGIDNVPQFTTQFAEDGSEQQYFDGFEIEYVIPWDQEYIEKEIEPFLSEECGFYIKHLSRKYGGYDWIDFKERSFNDLVNIGRYGTVNPTSKQRDKAAAGRGRKISDE